MMKKMLWSFLTGTTMAAGMAVLAWAKYRQWEKEVPYQTAPEPVRLTREYADLYLDLIELIEAEWREHQP